MVTHRNATVEDLYNTPDDGTYELIDGRLVHMSPTGARPGYIAGEILFFLKLYQREVGPGYAFGDNIGWIVNLPDRRSFSPDAAFTYNAEIDTDDFIKGAPIFAVEVRSKGDYGPVMNAEYAAKRADYFAAGTQVVWDVNPRMRTIAKYVKSSPDTPGHFSVGDIADAEPALPRWRVAVNDLFR